MIGSLGDPFSSYLTSDEYRQSLQGISGQFEGIGAEIASQAPDGTRVARRSARPAASSITDPLDGSPAERAGLGRRHRPRSTARALDGLTVDAARDRIRGAKGTVVHAGHRARRPPLRSPRHHPRRRPGQGGQQQGARRRHRRLHRLAGFSDAAADQVVAALREQLAAGRTKLILDLRGNPGGYVTAARKVASQFIGSGPVFWEQDAAGNQVADQRADRTASRRTRRCRSSSSSTAAARRPARSSPAHSRTRAGDAGRPAVVRQGHRPAVAGADRRGRGVQADDRPLADAGQALDPQDRAHAGRRRDPAEPAARGHRSRPRQGARGARRAGRRVARAGGGLSGEPPRPVALALVSRIGYGSRERKEVMCSDRQYSSCTTSQEMAV